MRHAPRGGDHRSREAAELEQLEDSRLALIGNSFHTGVTAWLCSQALAAAGMIADPLTPMEVQSLFYEKAKQRREQHEEKLRLDEELPAMQRFGAAALPARRAPGALAVSQPHF